MTRPSNVAAPADHRAPGELLLTAGVVAMANLQAQIDGLQHVVTAGRVAAVNDRAELIELVTLRGETLGRISDYEWAEGSADQLTREVPTEGIAFVARARARARFHRFAEALADLDRAQRLGACPATTDAERASIFQATGRYELAFAMYSEIANRRADSGSLGALATLCAERGDIAAAERFFDQSEERYRGVSPFPLALLGFRRGVMWLKEGDFARALTWFETAIHWLPAYAPAHGRMAEIEAALGDTEAAVARLVPLTTSADDPAYAGSLARILSQAGRAKEAAAWRNKAATRYGELAARHPEAFGGHATEF